MKSRDNIDYCEHGENEMACLKCQLKRERGYNSQLHAEVAHWKSEYNNLNNLIKDASRAKCRG